jgi:hypothetical protein
LGFEDLAASCSPAKAAKLLEWIFYSPREEEDVYALQQANVTSSHVETMSSSWCTSMAKVKELLYEILLSSNRCKECTYLLLKILDAQFALAAPTLLADIGCTIRSDKELSDFTVALC